MRFNKVVNCFVLFDANDFPDGVQLMEPSVVVEPDVALQKHRILGRGKLFASLAINWRVKHPLRQGIIELDIKLNRIDLTPRIVNALGRVKIQKQVLAKEFGIKRTQEVVSACKNGVLVIRCLCLGDCGPSTQEQNRENCQCKRLVKV